MSSAQPALKTEPAVAEVDKAMQAWFLQSIPIAERQPFSELDLRKISNALQNTERESWSRIPRIYATLRSINQLPLIDIFLTQGLSDVWFPFSHKTLPDSIHSQTARNDFITAQRLVLNTSLDLEREDGGHKHFSKQEDVPLIKLAELGRGGFGLVDKAISTVSGKEYARKLLLRGPTFRKNKDVLREFEVELAALKKLSHFHIVELVGSYTDPKYVGILTSPVAECNLKDYLAKPLSRNMRSLLRTSFGCLVAAVVYLHQSKIRHKDIKPQNILIKGDRILITDFGISRDWSEDESSTTIGPTPMTAKYCPPEVAHCQSRNLSADIWSLGCVLLEIWTRLCETPISALEAHLKSNGSRSPYYHSNTGGVRSWVQMLTSEIQDPGLQQPQIWIAIMMETDPERRYNAKRLFGMIQEHSLIPDAKYSFMGQCCMEENDFVDQRCMEEDDSEESVAHSEYKLDIDAVALETTTSNATSYSSSQAAIFSQPTEIITKEPPGQGKLQSSTPPPDDLDLSHLSMRAEEEIVKLVDRNNIDRRDPPESKAVEVTERPVHGTTIPQKPLTPPLVPPQVVIKEATLPRPYHPSVTEHILLQSAISGIPDSATPTHDLASAQLPANNSNFLSVPDARARKSTPVRNSSSIVTSETTIALKVHIDGAQKRFKVEFLSLLHSNIFFDTLRVLLSIPSERRVYVERYSYSSATWIVLDPDNQAIWKAMIRAAKAKLKLSLRITAMSTVSTIKGQAPPLSNHLANSGADQATSPERHMVLVEILFRDKAKKVNVPLKYFLHARTLLMTLRSHLGASAYEKISFQRYSDSANEWIVLDPANEKTHRQTVRAARLKGKVHIRAAIAGGKTIYGE